MNFIQFKIMRNSQTSTKFLLPIKVFIAFRFFTFHSFYSNFDIIIALLAPCNKIKPPYETEPGSPAENAVVISPRVCMFVCFQRRKIPSVYTEENDVYR